MTSLFLKPGENHARHAGGNSVPVRHRLILAVAGGPAAAMLGGGGRLRTVAVFERSFYVEDRRGRLACFLRDDLEPGPLNLLCSGWPEAPDGLLPVGSAWISTRESLLHPNVEIVLSQKRVWSPRRCPPFSPVLLCRGFGNLLDQVRRHCPSGSVARLLFSSPCSSSPWHRAVLMATAKGVASLASWLRGTASHEGILSLIGLGCGLTPSGDDVLAGALLGLHSLGLTEKAEALARTIHCASNRTNSISQAHIRAASEGLGSAVLHDCIAEVASGGGGLAAIIPRLSKIGSTSGWDALLGIAVAMRLRIES